MKSIFVARTGSWYCDSLGCRSTKRTRTTRLYRLVSSLNMLLLAAFVLGGSSKLAASADNGINAGAPKVVARVVDGIPAEISDYPWQVAIYLAGTRSPFCGGALIHPRIVVTAAHCIKGETRSGPYDLSLRSLAIGFGSALVDRHAFVPVDAKVLHKQWDPANVAAGNDIALLRLKHPIIEKQPTDGWILTEPVREAYANIAVPQPIDVFAGPLRQNNAARIAGWGRIEQGGASSRDLLTAALAIVEPSECTAMLRARKLSHTLRPDQLCAYALKGDACQGDSGGPLLAGSSGTGASGRGCAEGAVAGSGSGSASCGASTGGVGVGTGSRAATVGSGTGSGGVSGSAARNGVLRWIWARIRFRPDLRREGGLWFRDGLRNAFPARLRALAQWWALVQQWALAQLRARACP